MNRTWSRQPGGPVRIDRAHPLGAALDYLWLSRDHGGVDLVRGLPAPFFGSSNALVSTRLGRGVANTGTSGTVVPFQGGNRLPYIQVGLGYFTNASGNWAFSQLTNSGSGYLARLTLSSSTALALQVQHAFGTTRTISITPGSGSALSPNLFLMVSQVFSGTDYRLYADGQQRDGTLDAGTFASLDRLQPIGGNLNGGLLLSGFGFGRALPDEFLRKFTENPANAFGLIAPQRRYWMLGVSSGGVSGTLATTNANDTSTASGTTTVTGTSARTNANDTSSASGTTTVVGTLARTNANDTSTASGTTTVVGSSATTNADDTSAASGTVGSGGSTGTLATTNANDTSTASGTTTVVGTLATTNANDAPSASGWAGVVSGELAATNANDTSSATGSAGSETLRGRTRRRYKTPIPPDDVVLQAPVEEAPSVTTLLPDANTLIVTKGREVIRLSKVAKEKRRAAIEAKDEEAIERALMEWF